MSSSNSNNSNSNNSKQALQIKQDDRFFSRLMSKEASSSAANSSGRVYYGGASGAIPFVWELQPGTPKHPSTESIPPPLTPPPSYFCRSKSLQRNKNRSGNIIMNYIFTKSKSNVDHTISSFSASSTSSSSSSWSSYGSPLGSMNRKQYGGGHQIIKRSCYFVPVCTRSAVVCGVDEEEEEEYKLSPTSTPCFGGLKLRLLRRNLIKLGCYSNSSNSSKSLL